MKEELLDQPSVLQLEAPLYICTGTLGSYQDLVQIFDKCGNPKFMNYLFLGDYAGRA